MRPDLVKGAAMPETEAVRISPACGVPSIVGLPVGAVFWASDGTANTRADSATSPTVKARSGLSSPWPVAFRPLPRHPRHLRPSPEYRRHLRPSPDYPRDLRTLPDHPHPAAGLGSASRLESYTLWHHSLYPYGKH